MLLSLEPQLGGSCRREALYLIALLGLRQGEVIGLRWEDLDLSAGRLEVQQALQRVRRRYELVDLKTEGSRRTVKLPPTVVLKLREHRARQAADGSGRSAGLPSGAWSSPHRAARL